MDIANTVNRQAISPVMDNTSCGCAAIKMIQEYDFDKEFHYGIQLGTFRNYDKAAELQAVLMRSGWMSDVEKQGEFFSVVTGNYTNLDDAASLEYSLRLKGYHTLMVAVEQKGNA